MSDGEQNDPRDDEWETRASHWLSVGMMVLVGAVMMGFGVYSLLHGVRILGQDVNPAQAVTGVVVAGFGLLLFRWGFKRARRQGKL